MTQDEVIEMWNSVIKYAPSEVRITEFAKLVAAKERENVIQHLRELKVLSEDGAFTNEIRARGEA
jgi:hypothetical protein